jgi:hypothetical protein
VSNKTLRSRKQQSRVLRDNASQFRSVGVFDPIASIYGKSNAVRACLAAILTESIGAAFWGSKG